MGQVLRLRLPWKVGARKMGTLWRQMGVAVGVASLGITRPTSWSVVLEVCRVPVSVDML